MTGEPLSSRYARGATIAAVLIAAFWHLGFDLPSTATAWPTYTPAAAVGAAWAAYVGIGVVGSALLLRGARSRAAAWSLSAGALAIAAAVMAATPHGGIDTPANWATGSVGWLAVIALWHRPARELVAFLTLNAAAMLAALLATGTLTDTSLARYVMVILGSVTLQLGYSVSTHAFDTAATWAAASSARLAATQAEQAAIEAAAQTRAHRYQVLRDTCGQLLRELAGGADPADPGLRRRCAVAASHLRRLLAENDDVPEPLLHELRACADMAERRSVEVSLARLGRLPETTPEIRRALTGPAIEVLSTAAAQARITVVGIDGTIAVSVLADAPDFAPAPHPGIDIATYRQGPDLWIETRWPPAPSPLPSSKTTP
jgi:hypothetical protein